MSTRFFALLTRLGADKLANAAALGTKIEITQMAVGDGGGSLPTPHTTQAQLINERRRAAINVLSIDPKNTNQIIAEQVIPESEGGWWIREIGLFDKDGILIAVGNCAETYKPQLQEGSGRTQTLRMVLIVSSTDAVTLKIDPSVVLATREYVDSRVINSIKDHENSRRHPDATLKDKGLVILSSAVDSHSETQAATPKAVKVAYDLANGRVPATRKVNGKALSSDISLGAGDVGAYTPEEVDSRVNEAKSLANTANQNADNANNNANSRLEKNQNGADIPNIDTFNKNIGSCRAFSNGIDMGGSGTWTTFEFINWLKNYGAFEHPYWMCVGTFNYGKNRIITDTKCGHIHLAGAVVEVMGAYNFMTIRVTTAPDAADGGVPAAQFIYSNYGVGYKPGWRRDYNTILKPTLDELGLTDTVARADNAILRNPHNGELQTIYSNLLINGRLVANNEVHAQSDNIIIGLKTNEGYPEIVYKWADSGWNSLRVPRGHGTALSLGANCTAVDGFLKTASPIIKIWNDGQFETNNESEGAIVQRLSEGVYLITGALGFNADAGWGGVDGGVEIPICKNKLPLIWVNYEVLPDGTIKLMTYHREHRNAPEFAKNVRQGYSDGDLIDIPVGRSISVRVQMPEDSIWNQQQRKLSEPK